MRILLTNDDGIDADGINILADILSKDNEVYIIAPHTNRSGVSHCISMHKPLIMTECDDKKYMLEGYPADCVITALRGSLLPFVPDVVISGINNDYNLGTDIVYSGTCAGARQASLYGIPGIALSVGSCKNRDGSRDFRMLSDFAANNINILSQLCGEVNKNGSLGYFVNVNAPSVESYKGVKITGLSNREYKDSVKIEKNAEGKLQRIFCGGGVVSYGNEKSDVNAVENGYISVSIVHSECVSDDLKYSDIEKQFILTGC